MVSVVRKLFAPVAALLAGFHVWLFISQLADGRLSDPAVIARWVLALGIAGAIWQLRRQNVSLLWGRKATAVWLLAAVLHAPAVAERVGLPDPIATADVASVFVQASVAGLLLSALLLAGLARRQSRLRQLVRYSTALPARARVLPPGYFLLLAPRPPPLR